MIGVLGESSGTLQKIQKFSYGLSPTLTENLALFLWAKGKEVRDERSIL